MTQPLFIKICGLRTERDVDAAVEAGADAIGFVFADSPRHIDGTAAATLCRRVPESVLTVGVFRDQPLRDVRFLATTAGVVGVQLHGREDRSYYYDLAREGWTLIRGAAVNPPHMPRFGELGEDILLLDAPVPGSGTSWEWARKHGAGPGEKWLLAGGLTVDNVRSAIDATRPWGVDVSSGVEQSRGVKDADLITAFIKATRAHV